MQHIPVVSHALRRGTFILKMLDVVPTIQTSGSFHWQDLFIYSGEEPHRTRERREEESGTETEDSHWFQWWRGLLQGSWVVSPGTAVLGSLEIYLGQCISESSAGERVNSGSSVHSAGRAKVVSHSPGWRKGTASVRVSLPTTPPSCLTWSASCLHAVVFGQGYWQTDGQQCKDFKSYTNTSYRLLNVLSQRKKNMLLRHIKGFLPNFWITCGNTYDPRGLTSV